MGAQAVGRGGVESGKDERTRTLLEVGCVSSPLFASCAFTQEEEGNGARREEALLHSC